LVGAVAEDAEPAVSHDLMTAKSVRINNAGMKSNTIAAGLLVSWAIHDLEEILGARYWREVAIPRLRARYPAVPDAVWRRAEVETAQMAIAVGLVGIPVGIAAFRGVSTKGGSELFQVAVAGYGLHGVGHIAGSLLVRDYTPGVLTSPLIVIPYALWARRRLQPSGDWQPIPGRDLGLSLLAVPLLVGGAQVIAKQVHRWLRRPGVFHGSGSSH
jgi:hypothetical protein